MKTSSSLLPIIAGAMTVFAQGSDPSPFKQISNALEDADVVFETFDGSVTTTLAGFAALAALQTKLNGICAGGIITPVQLPAVQEEWLQDGKDLLEVVNATLNIVVEKKPFVEDALGQAGDSIAISTLDTFRDQVPPCIDLYRTAFDDTEGQQETIDALEAQGLALFDKAISTYNN